MFKINKKNLSAFLILGMLLTGCNSNPLNSPSINQNENSSSNQIIKTSNGSTLQFSKISSENLSLLNQSVGSNQTAPQSTVSSDSAIEESSSGGSVSFSAPVAPSIAPAGISADSRVASDIAIGYFPSHGMFEEYVIADIEEAKQDGFQGTYLQALDKIVKPIVQSWENDARLVSSNGNTDSTGENIDNENTQRYYQKYQWNFRFVSSNQKSALNFFISAESVLVIKQNWVLKDLDFATIDSSEAIDIVTKAIKDKQFKSPSNREQYVSRNAEILYEVPENARWNFYLWQEKSDLVWNVNFHVDNNNGGSPEPDIAYLESSEPGSDGEPILKKDSEPVSPVTTVWYSGGSATVNAKTGEITSLHRPTKYTNTYYPRPTPQPVPLPVEPQEDRPDEEPPVPTLAP